VPDSCSGTINDPELAVDSTIVKELFLQRPVEAANPASIAIKDLPGCHGMMLWIP